MNALEKRVASVFGTRDVPEVIGKNLVRYKEYLLRRLDWKTVLTGREDFLWEEFYVFGPGDKGEYENLKKTRPSYTDEYELMDITVVEPEKKIYSQR
jgi:hypothetical protein